MALTTAGLNAAVGGVTTAVTYIGLVNGSGTELSGGTYARVAVGSWGSASAGAQKLGADLTFNVPSGATVAGWRGYSASTAGTDFGGGTLTSEVYAAAGQYKLLAASTGYTAA